MHQITVGRLWEKIKVLWKIEVAEKLEAMIVDRKKDRIRIIFEFEFQGGPDQIKDAVEIRHRRPWE